MIEETSLLFTLALAVAAPLLNWLLDIVSETFGKRKLEYFRARIELYNYLASIADDLLKERITLAIRQDIERFLPAAKATQGSTFLSYRFVLHLIMAAAVVMLVTNTLLFLVLVDVPGRYVALAGSLIAAPLLVHRIAASKKIRILLVLTVAAFVFGLALLLNSIGIALTAQL